MSRGAERAAVEDIQRGRERADYYAEPADTRKGQRYAVVRYKRDARSMAGLIESLGSTPGAEQVRLLAVE